MDRAAEAPSGAAQQSRPPRPSSNSHQTILFGNRNGPRTLSPNPNHPSANRALLLCTVFPARSPACFLPNQEVCFARNLFGPRDFPSRKHLRVLSCSIADADPCRTGPHVQNGPASQSRTATFAHADIQISCSIRNKTLSYRIRSRSQKYMLTRQIQYQ